MAISMLLQEEGGVDLPKKENLKKTNDSKQTNFFQKKRLAQDEEEEETLKIAIAMPLEEQ